MPYTSDIPLEGSPLAASYKEAINGMRYDLSALNRYLPLLEQLSSTYPQGGGSGAGRTAVMAEIIAVFPEDTYNIGAPAYAFTEYNPYDDPILNPVSGLCWNVMEFGLVCDGQEGDVIPPGLTFDCLQDVFPGSGGPTYTCERIRVGTIVLVNDTQKNFGAGKLWAFSCPVPMCVECSEG